MSVSRIVYFYPAEDSSDRIKELLTAYLSQAFESEDGTLLLQLHEETNSDSPRLVMVGLFDSQDSLDYHRSTDYNADTFGSMENEGLLACQNDDVTGSPLYNSMDG